MTAEPPSLDGADQLTTAEAFPRVAVTLVGALGAVISVACTVVLVKSAAKSSPPSTVATDRLNLRCDPTKVSNLIMPPILRHVC